MGKAEYWDSDELSILVDPDYGDYGKYVELSSTQAVEVIQYALEAAQARRNGNQAQIQDADAELDGLLVSLKLLPKKARKR